MVQLLIFINFEYFLTEKEPVNIEIIYDGRFMPYDQNSSFKSKLFSNASIKLAE